MSALPHKVGSAEIVSPELKKVVMQFMENFLALGGDVSTLQRAVKELANRPVVSPEIEDIENYVTRAETAATTATSAKNAAIEAKGDAQAARNEAVPAAQTATSKAGEASVSAKNAATSETNASGYATNASQSALAASAQAQAAAASASAAAAYGWSTSFPIINTALVYSASNNTNVDGFPIAAFAPSATADDKYMVYVKFACTTAVTSGTRYFRLSRATSSGSSDDTVTDSRSATIAVGDTIDLSLLVSGTDWFYILNGSSSATAMTGQASFTTFVKIVKQEVQSQS